MRETGPKYGLGLAAQVAQLPVHFRVDNGLGLQLRDGTIEETFAGLTSRFLEWQADRMNRS